MATDPQGTVYVRLVPRVRPLARKLNARAHRAYFSKVPLGNVLEKLRQLDKVDAYYLGWRNGFAAAAGAANGHTEPTVRDVADALQAFAAYDAEPHDDLPKV